MPMGGFLDHAAAEEKNACRRGGCIAVNPSGMETHLLERGHSVRLRYRIITFDRKCRRQLWDG
jgi:hypothetical protein